jgi:hypothetical protein
MISPTGLFHPPPAPHFKTFLVFLIYCPKRPSFSTIDLMKLILRHLVKGDKKTPANIHPVCYLVIWMYINFPPARLLAESDRYLTNTSETPHAVAVLNVFRNVMPYNLAKITNVSRGSKRW